MTSSNTDRLGNIATTLTRIGSNPEKFDGAICPPAQRASTLLIERSEDMYDPNRQTYGLEGMAAQNALKQALCAVEGAEHCFLAPSGLFSCVLPFLAIGGSHVLVADNVYLPTRRFCNRTLRRLGRQAKYFDPVIGKDIETLIRPETSLIFIESPGSLTMEITDTKAILEIARKHNIPTVFDNTWSAGVFHQPLAMGVDIVIQATTKYQAGHADTISGAVLTNDEALAERLSDTHRDMGVAIAAEDAWLVLRGMRSMSVRMERSERSGLDIARWLSTHRHVTGVLHPALPDCPDHALWRRDFSGAAGLFSFTLTPCQPDDVHRFLNSLELFGLGYSWGGYESLAIWCDPQLTDRHHRQSYAGPLIRLSIGLEDPADLIADLDAALMRLSA